MVKNKKYLLIISLAIFILLIMPISYATDINTDANNDLGHYNNISSISNDDIIIDNSIDEIQTNDYNNKYNDEFNDEFNGNNIVSDREFGNYEKDIGSISKSSQSSKENILYETIFRYKLKIRLNGVIRNDYSW